MVYILLLLGLYVRKFLSFIFFSAIFLAFANILRNILFHSRHLLCLFIEEESKLLLNSVKFFCLLYFPLIVFRHLTICPLFLQLPQHDINVDAAWPELFIDHKGQYWDVPESISLDLSSVKSKSGLRYRVGLHKNGGVPRALNSTNNDDPPLTLMPGLCAKAAFSIEKKRYLWRVEEKKQDKTKKTGEGELDEMTSYDMRLKEPHAAISGIVGQSTAF